MLRLLIGPAGTGKTSAVLGELRQRVLRQQPCVHPGAVQGDLREIKEEGPCFLPLRT